MATFNTFSYFEMIDGFPDITLIQSDRHVDIRETKSKSGGR